MIYYKLSKEQKESEDNNEQKKTKLSTDSVDVYK